MKPTFSLWLIPESKASADFSRVISELASRFGSPVFPPHLTLLSRMPGTTTALLRRCLRLSENIPPMDIEVRSLAASGNYFRAIACELLCPRELAQTRKDAERLFPEHGPSPFLPHLSLVYGNIDQQQAEDAIQRMADLLPAHFVIDALELVTASSSTRVSTWRSHGRFPLTGSLA